MTNDIRAIKNKYLSETKEQKINISHHIAVGDHVIERKTGRKMIVNAINNDSTYKCDSETGVCLGNFHEHDLSY